MTSPRQFPIMIGFRGTPGPCPSAIPWDAIAPYEGMALKNHEQTLEKLASRGGLDPVEAYFIMTGKTWHDVRTPVTEAVMKEACSFLDQIVKDEIRAERDRLLLQNRALEARIEILSRKPLDTGLDNEEWRDGEHCVCNFDPHSHRVRKVCQFHETIYKEWAQAKDKVEATDRLNSELIEVLRRFANAGSLTQEQLIANKDAFMLLERIEKRLCECTSGITDGVTCVSCGKPRK